MIKKKTKIEMGTNVNHNTKQTNQETKKKPAKNKKQKKQ